MMATPPMLENGLPVVGHLLQFKQDRVGLFKRGLHEVGPVFGIKIGPQPAAVMIGPEFHQVFFMETDKKLSMHKSYRFLRAMFGDLLFTASPEVYQKQRPIVHAPFKREKMVAYLRIMQQQVQRWLDSLGDEGEMELTGQMIHLVQQVAGYAFMGEDFMNRMGREYWEQYADLSKGLDPVLPPNLPLPKFRRRDAAKERMRAMLRPLIRERRENPQQYNDFLQEFVDARFKDGSPMDDDLIINMILGLMFAGHETTAGQAAWTMIELIRNKEYQEIVRREIDEKVPPGKEINSDLLNELSHIEMAVREVERMHPSADLLLRTVEEEIELGGYRVPPGWLVIVSSAVAHRLDSLFPEPDRFDPLRYAPPREEDKQHRFALIGFGGGIHKCTGMNFAYNEMMVIAALFFQQFDAELVTQNLTTLYNAGASRPAPAIIHYKKRAGLNLS